jgi:hypothetical protein
MKIALVKQDVYQDLYVCSNRVSPREVLESTIMRVGPLGLFTLLDADFFIVKEGNEKECKTYLKSYRPKKEIIEQLRTSPINQIKGSFFDYLSPRSAHSHKEYALEPDDIKWADYDIVISINISIPSRIVKANTNTLWCYMIGEASRQNQYVEFGYDVRLTQNTTGEVANGLGTVDFPYTFLGPDCLEKIAGEYSAPKKKTGVFAEVNSISKRPVDSVPQLEFVRELGHDLVLHNQDIIENLIRLRNSKYFIKLGGRRIRGNSIIEAVSAGTLAIMDPKDAFGAQLLPKETWIHSESEIRELIGELDRDDRMYADLLAEQRRRLQFFVVDAPMESVRNCLRYKREGQYAERETFIKKLKEIRRNYF